MKSMSSALKKLKGKRSTCQRIPAMEEDDRRVSISHSTQSYSNRELDVDARSVRSLSPPASVEPSVSPHLKSYMDIMDMIQRAEKPSTFQDVNDQPPNPNQPIPDSCVGPKPKPWEIGQSSRNFLQSQGSGDGLNYEYQDNLTNGDSSRPWWQRKNARNRR